jgi:hypothetical protein
MRNTQHQDITNRIGTIHVLILLFVAMCFAVAVPACTHETVSPADPGPGNPIDTTGNGGGNGGGNNGTPCDENVVYFNVDILPLLQSNCAKSGCHDAASHQDGIVLTSYASVMNSDIVDPFDLDDSDLYEVITENDPDDMMPPPGNPRLTNAQIAMIAEWINQGAKDLTCDESNTGCNTDNVSYAGFVAPLLTTYCTGCHSGAAASGGVTLNTYDGARTVAMNGRLHGAISWASGFARMPQGGAQLPQCSIDKIKSWIDAGAPNN